MNDLRYLTLAHYYVDDVCPGTYITNAYGCKNDTCPNDFGCPADYFTFHPNGTFYTLIFHSDIDTPRPTSYFTSSQNFTQSNKFDQTNEFTPSDTFTQSDYFTCSSKFSDSNNFSPSFQFTISSPLKPQKTNTKQFTNSDEFTSSQKFTKSIEFSDSFKPTPTQSQIYNKITSTLTLSFTLISVRTVSFSASLFYSNSITLIMNEKGEMTESFIQSFYKVNLPYIIMSLSPMFVPITFEFEVTEIKQKITHEKLIGIVCGSVAIFFSVLGIIIFAFRKKNKNEVWSDDLSNSDDTSEEIVCGTEKETNFNISNMTNTVDDNWI